MKTSAKKPENCQVKLTVELDAAEVAEVVKNVEKTFVREARLPGFRPGKAPVELIRKSFAAEIKTEVDRSLFRKYYEDAVKAEKLDEVALANVEDLKHDENGGGFVATVDVKPTFKVPTYKGLKIAVNDTKVDDAAIASHIERLRAAYAKYEDAKEGDAVSDGDFVQIDYTGTIDGKPITDFNAEAKVVSNGTGFWTQVEEGRFVPEVLDALKGMKAGESKSGVKAKFDKDAAPEGLKGKKAEYAITLKSFRRRVLPNDADFLKELKVESIDKLTANVRESLEQQAVKAEAQRRENEAVELLMKKVDFDVPPSQVNRAMNAYLDDLAQRLQYSGLGDDYVEKNRDKILKDAEANAKRNVRMWYVLDAIAKAEKIEGKPEEIGKKVIEFVLANAKA